MLVVANACVIACICQIRIFAISRVETHRPAEERAVRKAKYTRQITQPLAKIHTIQYKESKKKRRNGTDAISKLKNG